MICVREILLRIKSAKKKLNILGEKTAECLGDYSAEYYLVVFGD